MLMRPSGPTVLTIALYAHILFALVQTCPDDSALSLKAWLSKSSRSSIATSELDVHLHALEILSTGVRHYRHYFDFIAWEPAVASLVRSHCYSPLLVVNSCMDSLWSLKRNRFRETKVILNHFVCNLECLFISPIEFFLTKIAELQ